jgi:predicted DNA-binding protein
MSDPQHPDQSRPTVITAVRLSPADRQSLKAAAQRRDTTVSELVRQAIRPLITETSAA